MTKRECYARDLRQLARYGLPDSNAYVKTRELLDEIAEFLVEEQVAIDRFFMRSDNGEDA